MPSTPNISGREYWQSLEQLAGDPAFVERVDREFPDYDPQEIAGMSRRKFLKLMAGSMALAGLTLSGCRRYPEEKLAPYARQPEGRMPGVAARYASMIELAGVATGLLVTSYDGRPIKIEGNPSHPYSLGATDAIAQASVLELYDPERSRGIIDRRGPTERAMSWADFARTYEVLFSPLRGDQGAGLAILCEQTSSLTVAGLRDRLLKAMPQAKWYEYEAISGDARVGASKLAFGNDKPLRPQYDLKKAKAIACFDADLLGSHPAKLKHARDWAAGRKSADDGEMNRMYVAESRYTLTGGVADERIALKPSRVDAVLVALAVKLGVEVSAGVTAHGAAGLELSERETHFVEWLARDLTHYGRQSLVVSGEQTSAHSQALAYRINAKLQAIGTTVNFIEEPGATDRPWHVDSIAKLTAAMNAGEVKTLLILGGNPAYDAPADVPFAAAIAKAQSSIHLSLYDNETSELVHYHVPRAHHLESWGDGRAWDGTITLQQPLILPLYNGRTIGGLLSLALTAKEREDYDLVREAIKPALPDDTFERNWRRSLHEGIVAQSASSVVTPTLRSGPLSLWERAGVRAGSSMTSHSTSTSPKTDTFQLTFHPHHTLHDGRFANNGWLQELPDPLTKITWDNPALISKRDADRLSIRTGDLIELQANGRTLKIPAYIMPGQPVGAIAVALGCGRGRAGHIGTNIGFNAYTLRFADSPYVAEVVITKTGETYSLAATQDHHLIDPIGFAGREKRVGEKGASGTIIKESSLKDYGKDKKFVQKDAHGGTHITLFEAPKQSNDPHAWGMAVDMNSCIGCGSCVVACQAENNIPIVGKEEVARGREMHWLRIDRYFKGSADDETPDIIYQPMMCVHCENAPCEQVCPVAATVHDTEGLNTMVYNRCIGTRYCSNNCPYKVRRFNYFDFHCKDPHGSAEPWLGMPDTQQREMIDPIKKMVFNPDVTVRMRGVMEKCSYCTQRIQSAKIARRNAGEEIQDGDIVTACQASCATGAIVFGNLNDPNSKVRKLQESNRAYAVLDELNVKPRTKYLAKVRNPADKE